MSRKDNINLKKGVMVGNNVSHSNRKTRRTFAPNLQSFTFGSEILGLKFKFKSAPSTMCTVLKFDGLDNFLLGTKSSKLASEALTVKKKILKAVKSKQEPTSS